MKKTKWLALFLSVVLMLGLLTACKTSDDVVSPDPDVTPIEDTEPSDTPNDEISDPTPEPFVPSEAIEFPELEGFEKTPAEFGGVGYASETVTMTVSIVPATPEQMAEVESGWDTELEGLLSDYYFGGEVLSSKLIDMPGLDRQGLELEILFPEDAYSFIGLIIPSDEQVIALLGLSGHDHEQELLDGYNEFVENLKLA